MASIGDVYRIITSWNVANDETARSVFHYQVVELTGSINAENVNDEMDTNLYSILQDLMPGGISINGSYALNMNDPDDFNITNPSRVGELAGDPLPSILAVGFRSPWPGPGKRRARHQFPIGTQGNFGPSSGVATAFRTLCDPLAIALGAQFELTDGAIDPVIVQSGWTPGFAPVVQGSARGQWEINAQWTTQKTRQTYLWLATS